MKRLSLCIAACAILLGLAATAAAADFPVTVSQIKIEGNSKIATSKILDAVKFHDGQSISADELKSSSQAIYDMGWFSEVIPDIQTGGEVIFRVKENPVVQKIEVSGNVNDEPFKILGVTLFRAPIMPTDRVKSILRDHDVKTGQVLNNNSLKAGLQAIIDAYDKKGYTLVMIGKVTPKPTLSIQIIEGKVVGNTITGLATVPKEVAEKMIDLPLGVPLQKTDIQQAIARLQSSVYFSNVAVKPQQGTAPDEIRLVWDLTERQLITSPITIKGIQLDGVTLFPESVARAALGTIPSGPINNYQLLQIVKGLYDLYYRNGYIMVRFAVESASNDVLHLKVEQGKIGKITIQGNTFTKDYVIQKNFGIKPGQILNRGRLAVAYQKLTSLGYFKSVNLVPSWKDDRVDIDLTITENQKLGGLNGSLAYSPQSGGIVGKLDYTQKNLAGTGQDLSFSYSRGLIEDQSAVWDLGYSTVGFFRDFNRVGLDLYRKSQDQTVDGNTTTYITIGGKASVSYPVADYTALNLSYENDEVRAAASTTWTPMDSFTVGLSYDDVNNPNFPTSGTRRSVSLKKSGGFAAGPSFSKLNAQWINFSPTHLNLPFLSERDQVLAVRLGLDWGTDLPASQAYDFGGTSMIRGTTATPASRLAFANFEYRVSLVEGLTATLFFDSGVNLDQVSLAGGKASFGAELVITAAGMRIRLDMAWVLGPDIGWVPDFGFGFGPMF
jgi:outer membrane protein insertion porin family